MPRSIQSGAEVEFLVKRAVKILSHLVLLRKVLVKLGAKSFIVGHNKRLLRLRLPDFYWFLYLKEVLLRA